MRLLLLNINYIQHQNILKFHAENNYGFCPLPNGVTLNNIPFTFVNYDLRKISSDKVTPKWLIINTFWCHLSLVTFAILSVLHYFAPQYTTFWIGSDYEKKRLFALRPIAHLKATRVTYSGDIWVT